jgi:hypothetical protein
VPLTHDTKPRILRAGPLIVVLESVFWHRQSYPKRRIAPVRPPLAEPASPREVEDPFRVGHGRAFRMPLTRRGVVLGWWEPAGEAVTSDEETAALLSAMEGSMIPGITATEIALWAKARDVEKLWERLRTWLLHWFAHELRGEPDVPRYVDRAYDGLRPDWTVSEWNGQRNGTWAAPPDEEHEVIDLTDRFGA